ncbi:hypothetical protein [Luteimonas aquatica]|uniref:hypothetical protein n=1 Tax=Luteimonas aquatica TaxID=450364 RepID=UPI001F59CB96|nr:hypothetical protein [Luteimonas aquatica]
MKAVLVATLILAAVSGSALAAADTLQQPGDIVAQQQAIRADVVAEKGRFESMPSVKRKQILADQDKLFALLEGKASASDLNDGERQQVSTLLASISGAIENKEDERMVCTREQRTGSNFTTKVCRSVAQIKAEKESADRDMKSFNTRSCGEKGCF